MHPLWLSGERMNKARFSPQSFADILSAAQGSPIRLLVLAFVIQAVALATRKHSPSVEDRNATATGWWPRYQNYTGGAPGSAIGWPNLGKESLSGRKLPSVESVE